MLVTVLKYIVETLVRRAVIQNDTGSIARGDPIAGRLHALCRLKDGNLGARGLDEGKLVSHTNNNQERNAVGESSMWRLTV